jgi:hypothetical protein
MKMNLFSWINFFLLSPGIPTMPGTPLNFMFDYEYLSACCAAFLLLKKIQRIQDAFKKKIDLWRIFFERGLTQYELTPKTNP